MTIWGLYFKVPDFSGLVYFLMAQLKQSWKYWYSGIVEGLWKTLAHVEWCTTQSRGIHKYVTCFALPICVLENGPTSDVTVGTFSISVAWAPSFLLYRIGHLIQHFHLSLWIIFKLLHTVIWVSFEKDQPLDWYFWFLTFFHYDNSIFPPFFDKIFLDLRDKFCCFDCVLV